MDIKIDEEALESYDASLRNIGHAADYIKDWYNMEVRGENIESAAEEVDQFPMKALGFQKEIIASLSQTNHPENEGAFRSTFGKFLESVEHAEYDRAISALQSIGVEQESAEKITSSYRTTYETQEDVTDLQQRLFDTYDPTETNEVVDEVRIGHEESSEPLTVLRYDSGDLGLGFRELVL